MLDGGILDSQAMNMKTIFFVLVSLLAAPQVLAVDASFTPLGDLPGGDFYSLALDISADGTTVVGVSSSESGDGTWEAFRWTVATGMVGLNNPGDDPTEISRASSVSADGSVAVGAKDGAFRWTESGGMSFLDDLTPGLISASAAWGVSADGSVIAGTGFGPNGMEAFRWTALDGIVGLGFLSQTLPDSSGFGLSADGAAVVGQSMSGPPDVEAIRWTAQSGTVGLGHLTLVPPGFFYALGWGISADGNTVVGQARTVDFEEAFRWTEETGMISLDPMRGTTFYSVAEDVSADGSIIVGIGEGLRAMVWDVNHGMRDIQNLLEDEHGLNLGDWVLRHAYGVSDDGTSIVGLGMNPNGDWEAWLVTLPRSVSVARRNGLSFDDPLAGN